FARLFEDFLDQSLQRFGVDRILEALGDHVLGNVAGPESVDADFLAVLLDLLIENPVQAFPLHFDFEHSLGAGGFADRRFHCIFLSELAPFPSGFGGDPPMGRVFIDPRQARIGFPSRAWRGRRYWCERGESNPHTEVPDPKSGASANSATFARFRRGGRIGARSRHCPRRRAPARLLGLLCDRTPLRPRRLEANSFSIRPPRKPFRRGILCLCLSFVREKPVPAFAPGRTFLSVDRLPSPRGALCLFNASSGKTLV